MTIAKRLKEFKSIMHLTSLEVSKELDISVRTFGSYERDEALPGSKFYYMLINKYNVNVNWLISGIGTMFINQNLPYNNDSISQLQAEIKFSNNDMNALLEMLKAESGRKIILKLIDVKRGDKNSIDYLINSLEGIKAVFN